MYNFSVLIQLDNKVYPVLTTGVFSDKVSVQRDENSLYLEYAIREDSLTYEHSRDVEKLIFTIFDSIIKDQVGIEDFYKLARMFYKGVVTLNAQISNPLTSFSVTDEEDNMPGNAKFSFRRRSDIANVTRVRGYDFTIIELTEKDQKFSIARAGESEPCFYLSFADVINVVNAVSSEKPFSFVEGTGIPGLQVSLDSSMHLTFFPTSVSSVNRIPDLSAAMQQVAELEKAVRAFIVHVQEIPAIYRVAATDALSGTAVLESRS